MNKLHSIEDLAFTWIVSSITLCAFFTNMVMCIQERSWVTLIVTTILFPVGLLRGILAWFGML
jgi:hypothetical protein